MLVMYIAEKKNTTTLLNMAAFTLIFHFNKNETDTCVLISWESRTLHC